jgi:hypothetical protein
MSAQESAMIQRANKWLQRLDDKEYRVVTEASSIKIPDMNGVHAPYSDLVSKAMTDYQSKTNTYAEIQRRAALGAVAVDFPYLVSQKLATLEQFKDWMKPILNDENTRKIADFVILTQVMSNRDNAARDFLYYIDHGIASGIIVEGDALKRKLTESEQERDRFRNECEELSTELISVRALYEECQRKLHIRPVGGQNPE